MHVYICTKRAIFESPDIDGDNECDYLLDPYYAQSPYTLYTISAYYCYIRCIYKLNPYAPNFIQKVFVYIIFVVRELFGSVCIEYALLHRPNCMEAGHNKGVLLPFSHNFAADRLQVWRLSSALAFRRPRAERSAWTWTRHPLGLDNAPRRRRRLLVSLVSLVSACFSYNM